MIADNLRLVHDRVASACAAAGRPVRTVTLLAVSKTFPAGDVREAWAAGQCAFGENQVQEGEAKIVALDDLGSALEWHLIGPLQSNKTRTAAERFSWVHSVDRLRIAERLNEQRPPQLPPLQVCIQVNLSGEATKSGVAPAGLAELATVLARLPRLKLRGLMAIPGASLDVEVQRRAFGRLRELRDGLNAAGLQLDTLSMGMSADLESAIAEGATIVRVGSAVFGRR